MNFDGIFGGMTVSSSGMSAEAARMAVISKNIANARVVAEPGGEPYRRQNVVFETVLDGEFGESGLPGEVRVRETVADVDTPFEEVFDPTHPMADPATGIVRFSNVNTVFEMVDLISASRSYEANLKAMGAWRDMVRQATRILEA